MLPLHEGLLQHVFGSAQFGLCASGLACAGVHDVLKAVRCWPRRANLAVFGTANHAGGLAITAELGNRGFGCPCTEVFFWT